MNYNRFNNRKPCTMSNNSIFFVWLQDVYTTIKTDTYYWQYVTNVASIGHLGTTLCNMWQYCMEPCCTIQGIRISHLLTISCWLPLTDVIIFEILPKQMTELAMSFASWQLVFWQTHSYLAQSSTFDSKQACILCDVLM